MGNTDLIRQFRAITKDYAQEQFDSLLRDVCQHIVTHNNYFDAIKNREEREKAENDLFWDIVTALADTGTLLVATKEFLHWVGDGYFDPDEWHGSA